ncbi:unnamed protein product [Amoebophrya sp. A120]|nr:unnamed protein product [Amoebophrya sp. A120]|eukprot:GSA120T00011207001.1
MATNPEFEYARERLELEFGKAAATVGWTLLSFGNDAAEGLSVGELMVFMRQLTQYSGTCPTGEETKSALVSLMQHNIVRVVDDGMFGLSATSTALAGGSSSSSSSSSLPPINKPARFYADLDSVFWRARFPEFVKVIQNVVNPAAARVMREVLHRGKVSVSTMVELFSLPYQGGQQEELQPDLLLQGNKKDNKRGRSGSAASNPAMKKLQTKKRQRQEDSEEEDAQMLQTSNQHPQQEQDTAATSKNKNTKAGDNFPRMELATLLRLVGELESSGWLIKANPLRRKTDNEVFREQLLKIARFNNDAKAAEIYHSANAELESLNLSQTVYRANLPLLNRHVVLSQIEEPLVGHIANKSAKLVFRALLRATEIGGGGGVGKKDTTSGGDNLLDHQLQSGPSVPQKYPSLKLKKPITPGMMGGGGQGGGAVPTQGRIVLQSQLSDDLSDVLTPEQIAEGLTLLLNETSGLVQRIAAGDLDDSMQMLLLNQSMTSTGSKSKRGPKSKKQKTAAAAAALAISPGGVGGRKPPPTSSSNSTKVQINSGDAFMLDGEQIWRQIYQDLYGRLIHWNHGPVAFRVFNFLNEDPIRYHDERRIEEVCLCSLPKVRRALNDLFRNGTLLIQEIPKGAHSVAAGPPPTAFGAQSGSYGRGLWLYAIDRSRVRLQMQKLLLLTIRNLSQRLESEKRGLVRLNQANNHGRNVLNPEQQAPLQQIGDFSLDFENNKGIADDVLSSRFLLLHNMYMLFREL